MQAMRQDSASLRVDASKAAELMGVNERTMRRHAASGKLPAETVASGLGGGAAGAAYQIPVESLPKAAQLKYFAELARPDIKVNGADLATYKAKFGEAGIDQLFRRQRAVLTVLGIRKAGGGGVTRAIEAVASEYGVSSRTLRRWETGYAEAGLAGIMDAVEYSNKGEFKNLCQLAKDCIEYAVCGHNKLPKSRILMRLQERAIQMGDDACENCPYCSGSEARDELRPEQLADYPICDRAMGRMIVPESCDAVERFVKTIPYQQKTYGQFGRRIWEAKHMHKTMRNKPRLVNTCWFGDHHELDLWVLDEKGKPVRPWLTAWMDALTGALVGCTLTLNPNGDTIADAFCRGATFTVGSEFHGLPTWAYMDNGKDYRSHRFEGERVVEVAVGKLNGELWEKRSLLENLGVAVKHATKYVAWAKPIERAFGTLEIWIKEIAGWSGNSIANRPEDNPRIIRKLIEHGKLMTFETFAKVFFEKILPEYHAFKGSDGVSPAELYARNEKARTDTPDWETLSVLKSLSEPRSVSPQGVQINKVMYWHPALEDYSGTKERVTVLYNRGQNMSVTIMKDGRYICEAVPLSGLDMLEANGDKLAAHMEEQGTQRRKVTGRIAHVRQATKRITLEMYAEEIDAQRGRNEATMVLMDAHRIAGDKRKVAEKARRSRQEAQAGEDAAREMMIRLGKNTARNAR